MFIDLSGPEEEKKIGGKNDFSIWGNRAKCKHSWVSCPYFSLHYFCIIIERCVLVHYLVYGENSGLDRVFTVWYPKKISNFLCEKDFLKRIWRNAQAATNRHRHAGTIKTKPKLFMLIYIVTITTYYFVVIQGVPYGCDKF